MRAISLWEGEARRIRGIWSTKRHGEPARKGAGRQREERVGWKADRAERRVRERKERRKGWRNKAASLCPALGVARIALVLARSARRILQRARRETLVVPAILLPTFAQIISPRQRRCCCCCCCCCCCYCCCCCCCCCCCYCCLRALVRRTFVPA